MLSNAKLMAFAATTDAERAKNFYRGRLGLRLDADEDFALVFDANGTQLRIQKVKEFTPPPFTVLGWEVEDIERAATTLAEKGIEFLRVDFIEQDVVGIWTSADGTRVGWFKDPDLNILSVTQFPVPTSS